MSSYETMGAILTHLCVKGVSTQGAIFRSLGVEWSTFRAAFEFLLDAGVISTQKDGVLLFVRFLQ